MADRFPLILNTNINQIQEIASGDQLDLTGNNIANAGIITATSFSGPVVAAGIITAVAADIDDFLDVGSNIQLGNAGIITSTGADINGDLDVDGHTNLDNVSVAGVTTITSSTYPLNVHADTTYQGILINGNVCPTVNYARNNSTTPEWKAGLSGNNADHFSISVGGANNDRLILRSDSATINGSYLNVNNLMLDHRLYHSADTDNFFQFGDDIQYFYTNNAERFKIQQSGVIITGIATVSSDIDANGDIKIDNANKSLQVGDITNDNFTNVRHLIVGTDGDIRGFTAQNDNASLIENLQGSTNQFLVLGDTDDTSSETLLGVSVVRSGTTYTRLSLSGTGNLHVQNNITLGGTVDGVDVAVVNTRVNQLWGGGNELKSTVKLQNGVYGTTQSAGDNSTKVATTAYTDTAIANLIDSSPSTLNTLNELAAALGDDANFSTTVTNSIATKMPLAGGTFSGNVSFGDNNITNVGTIALDTIKGDADDNTNINFAGSDIVNIKPAGTTRLSINTSGVVVTGDLNIGSSVGRFDSSGIIKTAHGTESAPSHTFINDNDNGMYRPTTNTLGFVCGGDEKLRITSTGVIGVGLDNPSVAGGYHGMEIGGTANSGLRLSTTSNGGWAFTDYEINGTQAYIVGCKGGSDSLSSASSWRICSGASFDANQLFVVNADGSVLPGSDNTQDFGSSSFRWANIYTGDLNLSNEGTVNDVDGTWGNFQIQEGENDLFLINKRNGKKYKFNLTEV